MFIDWAAFQACPTCGAGEGRQCRGVQVRSGTGRPPKDKLRRPHPHRWVIPGYHRTGPKPGPRDDVLHDRRMEAWRKGARTGRLVVDIAADLGMTRAALDQYIHRARRAGDPRAVHHLHGLPQVEAARRRHLGDTALRRPAHGSDTDRRN